MKNETMEGRYIDFKRLCIPSGQWLKQEEKQKEWNHRKHGKHGRKTSETRKLSVERIIK